MLPNGEHERRAVRRRGKVPPVSTTSEGRLGSGPMSLVSHSPLKTGCTRCWLAKCRNSAASCWPQDDDDDDDDHDDDDDDDASSRKATTTNRVDDDHH